MDGLAALRMTVNLNAVAHHRLTVEQAAMGVLGGDVAHHVVDPDDLLDLDPLRATELSEALPVLAGREPEAWILVLPTPGALGSLRGPAHVNQAALDVGEAVVALHGGLALVPFRVGRAVQWRVFAAMRPFAPPVPYDAERQLNEVVLGAAQALTRLDVASGVRPRAGLSASLAPGYSGRQQATADRAARLLAACDAALTSDGAAISAFEADARFRELRSVRAAAAQALCAAASWIAVD